MAKRRQTIEIFAPGNKGLFYGPPNTYLEPEMSPNLQDAKLYYGAVQKEYGTSLFATGTGSVLGAPVNLLFEAKFPGTNILEAFTHSNVYKYTANSDTFVSDGQAFSGTYTDFWSAVVHNNNMFYSNGLDPIQVKASVSATGTNLASALSPNTFKAWSLASFKEHLNLYHVYEDGVEYYKRVRWSMKGVLTLTAGATDFASGVAGGIDVQDIEGEIKCAWPVGGNMAIYSDRSIHTQYWVGGDEVYKFEKAISGIGTPTRRGVVAFGDVNYVFGHDNIYAYFGGGDLRAIGDPIKKELYSTINQSAFAYVWMEYDPIENQVLVHTPTGDSTQPDTSWVYRIDDDNWSKIRRSHTANARFTRQTALTFGEVQGNFGDANYRFGDASIRAASTTRLYSDKSGRIVKVDNTLFTVSQSGSDGAQSFIYETPDLTGANSVDPYDKTEKIDYTSYNKRWTELELEIAGTGNAHVLYSTDGGRNFTELPESPLAMSITGETHFLGVEERSEQIRFRITNTGSSDQIAITYVKAEFVPGSEN